MLSENQLLNHIYQTAEMGREGIRSVLKYAGEIGRASCRERVVGLV